MINDCLARGLGVAGHSIKEIAAKVAAGHRYFSSSVLRLIIASVLGIVYRIIATHLIKKAGHTRKAAQTEAATLIQRFGLALDLNIHFHMLFLDGVYVRLRVTTKTKGPS